MHCFNALYNEFACVQNQCCTTTIVLCAVIFWVELRGVDNAQVESATLPVATFSKFQPLTKDFLDLTNPKAVLEMRLR
jgi:hypothetical protein